MKIFYLFLVKVWIIWSAFAFIVVNSAPSPSNPDNYFHFNMTPKSGPTVPAK